MAADRPHRGKHRTRDATELSLREVRFCLHFFEHGNATDAYIDAKFHAADRPSACEQASKLLRKHEIRTYIRTLQREALDAAQVTANKVVQGLGRNAFADRRKLYDKNGRLLDAHEWPDDVAATVVEVTTEEIKAADGTVVGHVRKVKTERRTESLKSLGEHTGVLGKDKTAATGGAKAVLEVPAKEPLKELPDAR